MSVYDDARWIVERMLPMGDHPHRHVAHALLDLVDEFEGVDFRCDSPSPSVSSDSVVEFVRCGDCRSCRLDATLRRIKGDVDE